MGAQQFFQRRPFSFPPQFNPWDEDDLMQQQANPFQVGAPPPPPPQGMPPASSPPGVVPPPMAAGPGKVGFRDIMAQMGQAMAGQRAPSGIGALGQAVSNIGSAFGQAHGAAQRQKEYDFKEAQRAEAQAAVDARRLITQGRDDTRYDQGQEDRTRRETEREAAAERNLESLKQAESGADWYRDTIMGEQTDEIEDPAEIDPQTNEPALTKKQRILYGQFKSGKADPFDHMDALEAAEAKGVLAEKKEDDRQRTRLRQDATERRSEASRAQSARGEERTIAELSRKDAERERKDAEKKDYTDREVDAANATAEDDMLLEDARNYGSKGDEVHTPADSWPRMWTLKDWKASPERRQQVAQNALEILERKDQSRKDTRERKRSVRIEKFDKTSRTSELSDQAPVSATATGKQILGKSDKALDNRHKNFLLENHPGIALDDVFDRFKKPGVVKPADTYREIRSEVEMMDTKLEELSGTFDVAERRGMASQLLNVGPDGWMELLQRWYAEAGLPPPQPQP